MKTRFYQAECGDAALISYVGSDGKNHNVFIDAGYERSYRYVLASEIQRLEDLNQEIDLWVVSHIHDDHIGGVLSYIKAINRGYRKDIVKGWLYNAPRHSNKRLLESEVHDVSHFKSISQGDDLLAYLNSINKAPSIDIQSGYTIEDLFGLKLTVLSPNSQKLNELRDKYRLDRMIPFETHESDEISDAKAAKQSDYHIPIEDFNLNSKWKEDNSEENGSSIVLLTEFQGIKVLWLADAHPTVVVHALKDLGYSRENPLVCDWTKVTHHGSKGNNSNEIYEIIRCNNYLMSVNGYNKHGLPDKECLVRILRCGNRPKDSYYKFFFAYDDDSLRSIFAVDGEDAFNNWKFSVEYNSSAKWVEV